jgi:hypothetical protein
MASPKKIKKPRVVVSRNEKILGEYHPFQMASLIETGHLRSDDECLDPETEAWVPLWIFLKGVTIPGSIGDRDRAIPMLDDDSPDELPAWIAWLIALVCLVAALGMGLWGWMAHEENSGLKKSLASAETASSEWKQKYQNVLFAAREIAASDLVRGRVILRDASGKRISLPGITLNLYPRRELEDHLAERFARIADAGGTAPTLLAAHFLKNMPATAATTTTDSDGRFEFKIPSPGEYVIQTSLRSATTSEMQLWFVTFDSRDPLNTPVDITESNGVRQFNPLFMLVNGR